MRKTLHAFFHSKPARIIIPIAILFVSEASVVWSAQPPNGYTGAGPSGLGGGPTCVDCHSSFGLNSGGGSVTLQGFPGYYLAGQTYNLSVKITHGASDRTRWGFEMKAVNSNGQSVGTFASTNPNAGLSGDEISHLNAPVFGPASTYTFANITWTAPSSPTAADQNIKFYVSGNAANNSGDNSGDYIYNSNFTIPLAVTGISDLVDKEDERLKVMGNPVNGQLNFDYTVIAAEQVSFSVVDLSGKTVLSINKGKKTTGTYHQTLDISHLGNGLYFLRMQAGQKDFTRKLFVQ